MILNGKAIHPDDQLASLALYGNATFTTMVVANGNVKGLALHLQRLQQDAEALFGLPVNTAQVMANMRAFLARFTVPEPVTLRVTLFPQGFDMAKPEACSALNILVTGRPATGNLPALRCGLVASQRSLAGQKSGNMISLFKARRQARLAGADDALLTNGQQISEGATWNVFFIKDQQLITPALSSEILPGVTRQLVIDCCQAAGITVQQQRVTTSQLASFDAAFATNAAWGLRPISAIDDIEYVSGGSKLMGQVRSLFDQLPGEPHSV